MSNRTWPVCLVFYWGFTLVASAQTAAAPGTISGVVRDAGGSSPIQRAIVTLSTVETNPQDAVAWTDANGRFSFAFLPAGRYQLRASKDGYQGAALGAEMIGRPPAILKLAAGESRSDIVIRLQRMTFLSGTLLDEDGAPLANAQVMAMREAFRHQKRTLVPGLSAMTDGAGHYSLIGLAPGRYAIVASYHNRSPARIHPEAAVGEPPQQPYSYGVQYYPGTDREESATLLDVQPGQEISQLDFRLAGKPAAALQGKVVVPKGAASVSNVRVNISSEDLGPRTFMGFGAQPPEFSFGGGQLPTGSYLLVAQATVDGRRYRGVQKIDLGPQGLHDLAIALEPSVDLVGSVKVEGPDAEKHPASFIELVPGDGIPFNASLPRGAVNKDGSFKIMGVPPGVWDISVTPIPRDGYVKSMRLGDQDVLTEEMVIRGSTTEPLNILLGTLGAKIEGDVVRADQPAQAAVLLAPTGQFEHITSFYRLVSSDEQGHFEINNARPGEFRLYAFDKFDFQSIEDPDYLKPFESAATPVSLREGANGSKKLQVISSEQPAAAAPAHQNRERE